MTRNNLSFNLLNKGFRLAPRGRKITCGRNPEMSNSNTCGQCKAFRDYEDYEGKGWCLASEKPARHHHLKSNSCESALREYEEDILLQSIIQPKTITNISQPGQTKQFFWQQFSPRCGAIIAQDFETVHYLAFSTDEAAKVFIAAMTTGKFCQKTSQRPSKRFERDLYQWEVKVWGMSQLVFHELVRRDLNRQQTTPSQVLLQA